MTQTNTKQRQIYEQLKRLGIEEQECTAEANLILEHITGMTMEEQIVSGILDNCAANENKWKLEWEEKIENILKQRQQRIPLAYCLGEVDFDGLKLKIVPGVLIPRPDTETLIEEVIKWTKENELTGSALSIADIGVGSGAIAISLLKRLPQCTVCGCDISEKAINLAKENAQKYGVADRLTLVHGDWQKVLPNNFNVIVSNPPYIPKSLQEEKTLQPEIYFEPKEALFAGEDGLDFYRQFAKKLPEHFLSAENVLLNGRGAPSNKARRFAVSGCFAAFEIGDKQAEAALNIFEDAGWQNLCVKKDVHGLPRVLTGTPQ